MPSYFGISLPGVTLMLTTAPKLSLVMLLWDRNYRKHWQSAACPRRICPGCSDKGISDSGYVAWFRGFDLQLTHLDFSSRYAMSVSYAMRVSGLMEDR